MLNKGDAVYVTLISKKGTGYVERCVIAGIHDEYVKLYSLDTDRFLVADRERIITVPKMNELRGKIIARELYGEK